MTVNPLGLISIIVALSVAAMGAYVYFQDPANSLNKSYLVASVVMFFWNFFQFMYRSVLAYDISYVWFKAAVLFSAFVPPTLLFFVLEFTKSKRLLRSRLFFLFIFVPCSAISLLFAFTDLAMDGPLKVGRWYNTYAVGSVPRLFFFAMSWLLAIALAAVIRIAVAWIKRPRSEEEEVRRHHAQIITIGIGIMLFFDVLTELVLRARGAHPIFVATWAAGIYVILIGYAISRYELFSLNPRQAADDIVTTMSDMLVLINIHGKIAIVNRATLDLLGYSRDALVEQPVSIIFADQNLGLEMFQKTVSGRGSPEREAGFLAKTGRPVPVIVSSAAVRDRKQKIAGVVLTAKDITDRKETEQVLRRAKDELEIRVRERTAELEASNKNLARSNAELEQFAYVASHDLQEPLRMVSSYVQLLAKRYKGRLDSNADDFIGFAVEGAVRMKILLDDLLTYSRVTTRGKIAALTNSGETLDQTLLDLKKLIDESGATVTSGPLPEVRVDASQLRQVLANLIANAIKFRGEEPPRIHIAAERVGNEWVFSVKDNGIGIEPKYRERVFMIFQRLHAREKYPGTGIGLAICKKVVERHGGRIWLESKPGGGSTFYFSLPAEASERSKAS